MIITIFRELVLKKNTKYDSSSKFDTVKKEENKYLDAFQDEKGRSRKLQMILVNMNKRK